MAKTAGFYSGCMLQRWRFGNDGLLTDSYSVVRYHGNLFKQVYWSKIELIIDTPEHCGRAHDPLRPKVAPAMKVLWSSDQ